MAQVSTVATPYLYLTTSGWKSGNAHTIEIWFVEYRRCYYVVAEGRERAHWVQNVRHGPLVSFRVGRRTVTGTARIVDSAAEPKLAAEVAARMDAKYGWSDGLIVELRPLPTASPARAKGVSGLL